MAMPPSKARSGHTGAVPPLPATDPLEGGSVGLPVLDPIVALQVVGQGTELVLPVDKEVSKLGKAPTPAVDLVLHSSRVSKIHASLHRRGHRLRVVDEGSTNGTYVDGRREKELELTAGHTFHAADVPLLVLDEPLRSLRATLQWCLGLDAHAIIDDILEHAPRGGPILLEGRPGCDQSRLARALHDASPRRREPYVAIEAPLGSRDEQRAMIAQNARGTVFLDLADFAELPAFFVKLLFSSEHRVRVIVAADSFRTLELRMGDVARLFRTIKLPTLVERSPELPRLLDMLFAEAGSTHRAAELGDRRVQALQSLPWPGNFDDLRRVRPKLLALLKAGSLRGAARLLGISVQSVSETFERLGFRSEDAPGRGPSSRTTRHRTGS